MSLSKLLLSILSVIVLLIAVPLIWWLAVHNTAPQSLEIDTRSEKVTVYSDLKENNIAFKAGEDLKRSDTIQARENYNLALQSTNSAAEEAQIKFKLALTYQLANGSDNDLTQAIALFKEIAVNEAYPNVFRAYAVMRLGLLYDVYGYGEQAALLISETFTGSPFDSFLEEGDLASSYLNLYEHSLELRPNAIADLRSAQIYMHKLEVEHEAGRDISQLAQSYIPLVLERIKRAELDMSVIEGDENASALLPIALMRMGVLVANLSYYANLLGEPYISMVKTDDITIARAEQSFSKALQIRTLRGGLDSFDRFMYASTLDRYAVGREVDIKKIMIPVYLESAGRDEAFKSFVAAQAESDTWMHESLVNMANLDSAFKQYLISTGWTETNFSI